MASRLLASVQVLGCAVLQLCAAVAVVPVAFKAVASARNMPNCFTDARLPGSYFKAGCIPRRTPTGRANSSIEDPSHDSSPAENECEFSHTKLTKQIGFEAPLESFAEIF